MNEPDERREAAVKRLNAKRGFKSHLAAYVIVNTMLVAIWALSDASYFWPIWTILGWGVGLAFNAWAVYFQRPVNEAEIRREIERGDPSP